MDDDVLRARIEEASAIALDSAARHPYERRQTAVLLARLQSPDQRRALLLHGPRRVGKSLLLHQMLARLRATGRPAFYVDLTDVTLRGDTIIQDIVELLVRSDGDRPVVLIDEVHYGGPTWPQQLKLVVDRARATLAVADSSGIELHRGAAEALVGRLDKEPIHPLSLAERLALQAHLGQRLPVSAVDRQRAVYEYLGFGGFPEYALARDAILTYQRMRDDMLLRAIEDLARSYGVRNPEGIERLLVSLVASSGRERDVSSAATVASTTAVTARSWLDQLRETGLVWELPRRARSLGAHARSPVKIYACDPAVVAACSAATVARPDAEVLGAQVETAIAQTLRAFATARGARLSYAKAVSGRRFTGEIDFVLERGAARVALETTAGDVRDKIASVTSTASAAGLEPGWLGVTSPRLLERSVVKHSGASVHLVPVYDLLVGLSGDPEKELGWPSI